MKDSIDLARSGRRSAAAYVLPMAVVFLGFLVFGFAENVKGPAIPRIQSDYRLDELGIGLLLATNSLGYLIACSFTGALIARAGNKAVSLLAFFSMALSGVCIWLSVSYPALFGSYFLMNIGNGILEIALAVLAARIFTRNTGFMMNLSHFFYGLSSMIAPAMAVWLMSVPVGGEALGWRGMYMWTMMLALIPLFIALPAKFPGAGARQGERLSLRQYARDRDAWLIVAMLSLGVTAELSIGSWLVNFLEKAYQWDATASSRMLSAFFGCFMLARLVLGAVADKFGYVRSIVVFAAFAGICTIAALFAGEPGAFLFALAGAGIAPIYPTVMALLAVKYPGSTDTAISFTVTVMGIAVVIGNFLVGFITDAARIGFSETAGPELGLVRGLQSGYAFIGVCACLCAVVGIALHRRLRRQGAAL